MELFFLYHHLVHSVQTYKHLKLESCFLLLIVF